MNQIIKIDKSIIGADEVNSVNAREIYEYLQVRTRFNDWISRAIKKYDFIENVDYVLVTQKRVTKNRGGNQKETKDYIVTIDMAKELAMLENNKKGKEIRKYFIAVEKAYRDNLNLRELYGRIGGLINSNNKYRDQINCLEEMLQQEEQKRLTNKKGCVLSYRTFGRNNLLDFIGSVQRQQQDMGEILTLLLGHHRDINNTMNSFLRTYPEIDPQSKSRGFAGEFINININN